LKKRIAACIVFLSLSSPLLAEYNIDLFGAYMKSGSNRDQLGGGGTFGFSVYPGLNVLYRGMYTFSSRKSPYFEPREYNQMMQMAGLEYVLSIPVIRIGWRSSFMAGYSRTRIDKIDLEQSFIESLMASTLATPPPGFILTRNMFRSRRRVDSGIALAFWTGFQVELLPFMAPFIDIGLCRSFYFSELGGRELPGLQVMFGLRFIFGAAERY
jgi:hypothetical protein